MCVCVVSVLNVFDRNDGSCLHLQQVVCHLSLFDRSLTVYINTRTRTRIYMRVCVCLCVCVFACIHSCLVSSTDVKFFTKFKRMYGILVTVVGNWYQPTDRPTNHIAHTHSHSHSHTHTFPSSSIQHHTNKFFLAYHFEILYI